MVRFSMLLGAIAVTVSLLAGWGCHGHVIPRPFVPNHGREFDLADPPCRPAPRPACGPGDLLLRYLGAGGLYIEWGEVAILTAPFFSNPGLLRAGFGSTGWDESAIRRGIEGLPLDQVAAVLVGHSHYDHLGDLPPILLDHAVSAEVHVNRSGANMLSAFPRLDGRLRVLEESAGKWVRLRGPDGRPLPARFMPLESEHADHFGSFHYAKGEVTEPWTTWRGRRLRGMKEGRTFAFLIDLLSPDDERVAFRIHYQDAACSPPSGLPPAEIIQERAADLAVLCMAAFWLADDYPGAVLRRTRARHLLVIHYEDFFRSTEKPLRFVPLLTDRRAERFLEQVRSEMADPVHRAAGPRPCGCGPCGEAWSIPLPGEWLRFHGEARP